MKELRDIIRAHENAEKEGKKSALATVVHLDGSAYRRPGARMLVEEDGKLTGAISGGCLEGDALRKAQLVMVQNKPMLVTYDTTDDDDAKVGAGLGCNGIISILIEPVNARDESNPIALLRAVSENRQPAVLVTLFSLEQKTAQTGTCMVITESGVLKNALPPGILHESLLTEAMMVLKTRKSVTKMYPEENRLAGFIEIVNPAVSLVIFGAGNDAIPLVEMANILGWDITVVDGRPNYATVQRFPVANRILIAKAEIGITQLDFDRRTVAILMSHNYNYDIAALRAMVRLPLEYIGVLGPKKKLELMLDELKEEGTLQRNENLSNVYGPTGLDIGAETAEEIALSIISEIKAVLSKRNGSSLRDKEETIHPRESPKGN